jgi:hypothetical protein
MKAVQAKQVSPTVSAEGVVSPEAIAKVQEQTALTEEAKAAERDKRLNRLL